MKRILCAAFAFLMLFGCSPTSEFADSGASAASDETASTVSSAVPMGEEIPFLLSEHRDTVWADAVQQLEIDPGGQATIRINGYWMTLTQTEDNTCILTAEFSENLYSSPVYGLSVAKLRLRTDGASVRAEIAEDPYGIFSDLKGSGLLFSYLETYQEHHPYQWLSVYPSALPAEQPGTKWRMWMKIGEKEDALHLFSDENGQVRGTWEHGIISDGPESVIPCALLTNSSAAAVVAYDENGYGDVLLFGKKADTPYYNEEAYRYSSLRIHADYCVFGTPTPESWYGNAETGVLWMIRKGTADSEWYDPYTALEDGDYTLIMGVDQIIADYYLTCGGWTPVGSQKNYDRLRVYQKDGEVLAIMFDEAETDFGLGYCAVGYIGYNPDGSVKRWGGLKPLDHTLAEQYEYRHGESDFLAACGVQGYYYGENGYLYFTDDMQTVYVAQWNGDIAFSVHSLLPPETEN